MTEFLYSNNAQATLASPINSTTTTVALASGSGVLFPSPGAGQQFAVTLVAAANPLPQFGEIVYCISRSGDSLTVVRAQEGTTAQNFLAGDFAWGLITAGELAAFAQTSSLSSSFYEGTDTGSANAVNVPTLTPSLSVPVAGELFLIIKSGNSNTGAVAMQIASGTSYSVVYKDGSSLNAGDWPANSAAFLYFTGSIFQFLACQASTPFTSLVHYGVDTGSANAIAASVVPPVSSLTDGQVFEITPADSNTGSTTLNINSIGAQPVIRADGTAIQAGDIKEGVKSLIAWSANQSAFVLLGVETSQQPARNLTSYTSNGTYTWTVPAGIFWVNAIVVGAGGGGAGGAGDSTWSSGGGGGGGTAQDWIPVTPGEEITVIVGAGGAGSAQGDGNSGSAGGTSSFGASLGASGGAGGTGGTSTSSGGTPGIGLGGPLDLYGTTGGDGNPGNNQAQGGPGGASSLGGGGRTGTLQGAGTNGLAPGSGGGGIWGDDATGQDGGDGADGAVIITY